MLSKLKRKQYLPIQIKIQAKELYFDPFSDYYGNFSKLSEKYGVSAPTIQHWTKQNMEKEEVMKRLSRRGRKRKCNAELENEIIKLVEKKRSKKKIVKCKTIQKWLSQNAKMFLRVQRISEILRRNGFTSQRVRKVKSKRTQKDQKEKILEFLHQINSEEWNEDQVYVMDESGIFEDDSDFYTYDLKGADSPEVETPNIAARSTIVSTLRGDGKNLPLYYIVHRKAKYKNHQIVEKAINGMNIELFLDYISKVLQTNADSSERKLLLMDNLRVHHAKVVLSKLEELGFECRFFPAYAACDLSPLDNSFFHELKSRFNDIPHSDPQTKENAIIEASESIPQEHIIHYWGHCGYVFHKRKEEKEENNQEKEEIKTNLHNQPMKTTKQKGNPNPNHNSKGLSNEITLQQSRISRIICDAIINFKPPNYHSIHILDDKFLDRLNISQWLSISDINFALSTFLLEEDFLPAEWINEKLQKLIQFFHSQEININNKFQIRSFLNQNDISQNQKIQQFQEGNEYKKLKELYLEFKSSRIEIDQMEMIYDFLKSKNFESDLEIQELQKNFLKEFLPIYHNWKMKNTFQEVYQKLHNMLQHHKQEFPIVVFFASHFYVFYINLRTNELEIFDSFGDYMKQQILKLANILVDFIDTFFDIKFVIKRIFNKPYQLNASDCGVFSSLIIWLKSVHQIPNEEIIRDLTQIHAEWFRFFLLKSFDYFHDCFRNEIDWDFFNQAIISSNSFNPRKTFKKQ